MKYTPNQRNAQIITVLYDIKLENIANLSSMMTNGWEASASLIASAEWDFVGTTNLKKKRGTFNTFSIPSNTNLKNHPQNH